MSSNNTLDIHVFNYYVCHLEGSIDDLSFMDFDYNRTAALFYNKNLGVINGEYSKKYIKHKHKYIYGHARK